MRITVNINKRYAYLIIGLLILTAGIFIVNAYGGNQPSVVGHSINEVAPPTDCADTQVLSYYKTSGWICTNLPIDTDTWRPRGKGIYTIHSSCSGSGSFTIVSTCETIKCKEPYAAPPTYLSCSGTCNNLGNPATCNNNLIGYLVD